MSAVKRSPALPAARDMAEPHDRRRGRRVFLGSLLAAVTVIGVLAGALPAQAGPVGSPDGHFDSVTATPSGLSVQGWAADPNYVGPLVVSVAIDGRVVGTGTATLPRPDVALVHPVFGPNHGFNLSYNVASGPHTVCITAMNRGAGANISLGCRASTVVASPVGHVDTVTSAVGGVIFRGWAFDPDSAAPISITVSEGGTVLATAQTGSARPDIASTQQAPPDTGFAIVVPVVTAGPHTLCTNAVNVGPGSSVVVECRTVTVRVNPVGVIHAAKRVTNSTVIAVDGWALDPQTGNPLSVQITIDGVLLRTISASLPVTGLNTGYYGSGIRHAFSALLAADGSAHTICAIAVNVGVGQNTSIGCATVGISPFAAVTSPALISTSRYIRNINGSSADRAKTLAMGATDASNNPANHQYLTLLQIGGQTTTGVILSATSTFVTYAQTVTALEGYIDGYAAHQTFNAPAFIAVGTNNDIDVRSVTGAIWATQVINPLRAYARKYRNMTIFGADDMEPGFIGTPAATKAWLTGYLAATAAPFVFNGSADGCGWTSPASTCNNGWTAADLAWLSGGAAPTRISSLPQIYNYTMPVQWKYISLTNVVAGKASVNFAGPLTEWTACYTQGGGCGSLTNNTAWSALWAQLQSDPRVRQASMPFGTDLRIN